MTYEETLAIADEFFSAFLDAELKGVRMARPADINMSIVPSIDVLISQHEPQDIIKKDIKREIHLYLTFEKGQFSNA